MYATITNVNISFCGITKPLQQEVGLCFVNWIILRTKYIELITLSENNLFHNHDNKKYLVQMVPLNNQFLVVFFQDKRPMDTMITFRSLFHQ